MGILVSWEAATVLVAVIATLVSLCTFVQQREQNKLSVAPFLDVSFEAGPRALKVNILNNGNGPLIVKGMRITSKSGSSFPGGFRDRAYRFEEFYSAALREVIPDCDQSLRDALFSGYYCYTWSFDGRSESSIRAGACVKFLEIQVSHDIMSPAINRMIHEVAQHQIECEYEDLYRNKRNKTIDLAFLEGGERNTPLPQRPQPERDGHEAEQR